MRHKTILALLLLVMLPLRAEAAERSFAGWVAACRDDGYCSASAYSETGPAGGSTAVDLLRIGRHAEQSYWEISLTTAAAMADAGREFVVSVDTVPEIFSGPEEVGAYGAFDSFFLLGDGAQRVMDRMMPGQQLTADYTSTSGDMQQARFSLSGLTAALIWIDEWQTRLGSERVASVPPFGLEPMADGTTTIPAMLRDRIAADPECSLPDEPANPDDIMVSQLDDQHTLYIVPCEALFYNTRHKLYVAAAGTFTSLVFDEWSGRNWLKSDTLPGASFDGNTGILSSTLRGGNGDCGAAARWHWNGANFVMDEYRSKANCRSPVSDWPRLSPPAG